MLDDPSSVKYDNKYISVENLWDLPFIQHRSCHGFKVARHSFLLKRAILRVYARLYHMYRYMYVTCQRNKRQELAESAGSNCLGWIGREKNLEIVTHPQN